MIILFQRCVGSFICIHLFFAGTSFGQINAGKLVSGKVYFEIPYSNADSAISLNITLKQKSHRFILDTGAPTFISESLQEQCKFPVIYKTEVTDATGKKDEIVIVKIDTVRAGPLVFVDIPALILKFKNSPLHCADFSGNFGSNVLRFLITQVDIKARKVIITGDENILKKETLDEFKPVKLNDQSDLFFPLTINKDLTDSAHFDSGDAAFYRMCDTTWQKFSKLYGDQVLQRGIGVTALGALGVPQKSEQVILKPAVISIAGANIAAPIVNNTSAEKSRVGRYLFNYGIVTLDYIHKRYCFKTYAQPYLPTKYDFGFAFVIDRKKVIAGTVWQNSEAEKKGIKSGSEILSINGISISSIEECEIESELKKQIVADSIELVFKDAGKIVLQRKVLN